MDIDAQLRAARRLARIKVGQRRNEGYRHAKAMAAFISRTKRLDARLKAGRSGGSKLKPGEFAQRILAQRQAIPGNGIPEKNPRRLARIAAQKRGMARARARAASVAGASRGGGGSASASSGAGSHDNR